MNTEALPSVMTAARECAMQMLLNAAYIQKELPGIQLDASLRTKTEQLCSTLIGTKHDVFSEIFNLHDLVNSPTPDVAAIGSGLERVMAMVWSDMETMNEVVTEIEEAGERDRDMMLAYMLVSESATNILNTFNKFTAAADACLKDEQLNGHQTTPPHAAGNRTQVSAQK